MANSQVVLVVQSFDNAVDTYVVDTRHTPLVFNLVNGAIPAELVQKHIKQFWFNGWDCATFCSVDHVAQNLPNYWELLNGAPFVDAADAFYPLATANNCGIICESEDLSQVL